MSTLFLGGDIPGYMPKQTGLTQRDSSDARMRKIVRQAWNGENASGTILGRKRVVTPFRAVNNSGDFLARQNYVCNPIPPGNTNYSSRFSGMFKAAASNCDSSGIPGAACNPRFVADSSEYARFRRERAINLTYNNRK